MHKVQPSEGTKELTVSMRAPSFSGHQATCFPFPEAFIVTTFLYILLETEHTSTNKLYVLFSPHTNDGVLSKMFYRLLFFFSHLRNTSKRNYWGKTVSSKIMLDTSKLPLKKLYQLKLSPAMYVFKSFANLIY